MRETTFKYNEYKNTHTLGVEEAFFNLARDIKKRLIDTAQEKDSKDGKITVDDKKTSAAGCCCMFSLVCCFP